MSGDDLLKRMVRSLCGSQRFPAQVVAVPTQHRLPAVYSRAAIDGDATLLLVTIRSDAYGLMQSASAPAGIDQVPLSLGPLPKGRSLAFIRELSEVLRPV
jgi:hypothetical protein